MRYVTLILVLLITPFSLRSNATGRSWRELFDFADSLVLYGQVDSARTIVNAALSNEISSLGRSDTTVAVFVYEEGVPRSYYFRSYGEAEHLYKRAISAKERMSPSDDVGLAQLLYDAGEFYRDRCWYSKAKPLYERALAIAEAAADSECILIAISLRGLADAYVGLADYDNAHPLYERSLSISNKVFGEKHPHTAACVGGLGRIYLAEREDIKAEEFMMRALAVQKEMLGTDSPHVAGCLINLGFCHYLRGEHEAAESLFTKALPVYERAYGRVHPRVVTALGCLGLCYNYQGKYEQAGSVLTRALVIEESPYGPDQVYVARALENIAICYVDQAKYPQAESRIRRSLAIQEKAYGPHHLDIAGTLNNLAVVCSYQGKLAEVEPLYIRSIEIYRKCLHPEHPSVGMGLVNLGVHYDNQYDYTKALKHYKLGLAILEKTLDPDDNLVASALTNIAEVYRIQGKYVDAEPLYKRALEIKERNYPPEHPELAYAMSNLGQLYLVTGRHVEAQELFEQALTILDRAFEGTHPDADESLWGLAQICINQGEYDRADTYLNRALALMEGTPGLDTCGVSWILEGVSVNRRFQGRPNEAMELAARALTIRRAMFIENASVLSERDAITYSQAMRYSFDNYLSCCTDIGFDDQSVAEDAASKILSCKGEISDGIFERQKALAFAPDSTMTLIHGQLKLVKAELSDLFVEGPCEGRETYWNKVDSLSVLTNVLESKLSRYMASLRLGSVNEEISTSAISSRLPDNTVLVEYVKYQYRQLRPQEYLPKYIAAVISKGESPVIVCLSGASSVDSLVNIYRKHMLDISTTGRITASDQQSYRRIGRELYAAIWKPVSRYVDGKDMVLVAPDGALTMVSFASLLDDNGTDLPTGE
jgi:tetratricopeptide (TPR) repeat protein